MQATPTASVEPASPPEVSTPEPESEAPVAKKQARRKRAMKKATTKRTSTRTARRVGRPKGSSGGVNKSQAIRNYLAAHPRAKPLAVATALGGQGLDVSPAFVSAVKFHAKGRSRRTAKRAPAALTPSAQRGRSAAGRNGVLTVERLVATKQFVDSVGGLAHARAALAALEQVLR